MMQQQQETFCGITKALRGHTLNNMRDKPELDEELEVDVGLQLLLGGYGVVARSGVVASHSGNGVGGHGVMCNIMH